MKILYAIQGTGNGHLARATEIVPILQKMGETDVLVSGIQGDIKLPFQIDYQLYGMSFIFGKNGGVSLLKTVIKLRPFRFLIDLIRLPIKKYDLILCDFEPVTAWACKIRGVECLGVSHQNAVLHPNAPEPAAKDWLGEFILNHYAPTNPQYGFHFKSLDEFNFTPVVRPSVRKAIIKNKGHYTVYLPAYSDEEIIEILSPFKAMSWEVFSKHSHQVYRVDNIHIRPVSLDQFTISFTNCMGILCNAGFETPAEAIFMGKKLCVVPMKNQYEQACNAAFLQSMGITVVNDLKSNSGKISAWLNQADALHINYPDETQAVFEKIITRAQLAESKT